MTVSKVGSRQENEVFCYDSMYSSLSQDTKNNSLSLLQPKDGNLGVVVKPLKKQTDGNDCGRYAVELLLRYRRYEPNSPEF